MNPDQFDRNGEAQRALELLELGDAFIELAPDWRIVRVNRNQERLSQKPRSETLGRVFWEVWPETATPESAYWREYHRCMQERVPVQFVEYYAPLDLWTGVTAYPTSNGGIAVFFRDVSEHRRAEQALREADARKSEFLGLLSHELRNPLVPIRNSVHILGHADPTSEQAHRARAIIGRQVEHIARLVEDLLDVRRISTGKLRLHRNRMDLVEAVGESVEDIRPLFASRSLTLDFHAPPAPVWVNGDRTRLTQVVSNLLHNASKFTDPGGHVWVTVETRDRQARIVVRDDGVGIAPDVARKLFEPFVQSEATIHRSRGGLGLGLSLVRGIAELHGGTVAARSDGVGMGAEFVVVLPETEAGAAPAREPEAPASFTRRRVLVIEDSDDSAQSLRDVLEVLGGHEVHVASDGEAGVEAALRLCPDVILCDVGLPVIDGYEVARRIRADGGACDARLVAFSGYASPEDVERALRAGFDYHVAKPPDVDRLLQLVAEAPSPGVPGTLPSALATGHHEVDLQHASILAEAMRLRRADADGVWESVRFLQHHTGSHFAYEESLMQDLAYPHAESHQQRHREFQERFAQLRDQLERDGATPENLGALANAVESWVTEHVLDADLRFAEFIRRRQDAAA